MEKLRESVSAHIDGYEQRLNFLLGLCLLLEGVVVACLLLWLADQVHGQGQT